ncbi:MAG: 2-dehydropantoate 2-reductase, partial [SAR202 cluster bacterium]|nr:2-dehydropantoate 2-reductase [SAR202 cluster bacterium]
MEGAMHVVVMGTGGVGGYFGALLARAGHRVTAIARGAHLDAMRASGLRVESAVEPAFTASVSATPQPPADDPADLVMLCVKSYDTAAAIERIRPSIAPRTLVLTLQNGVDSGDLLAAAFGPRHVVEGVAYVETTVKAPGVIGQLGGPRRILMGARDAANQPRVAALVAETREAGWLAEHVPAIREALWSKLVFIGPFAAVNTLTDAPARVIRDNPATAALIRQAMAEYAAVGQATGVALPADAVDKAFATLLAFPAAGHSSMSRDRQAGKRLEADALVGTIARRGAALGVPTPATSTLAA